MVRNCAVHFETNYGGRFRLLNNAENPFNMGYDLELHTSPELAPDAVSCYLTIISDLRWMMELGINDIITEGSLLSSHVVLPREGNLKVAMHVMAHVGQKYKSRLVYDPLYPEIDHSVFKKCYW